jgi:hypothetical protein
VSSELTKSSKSNEKALKLKIVELNKKIIKALGDKDYKEKIE